MSSLQKKRKSITIAMKIFCLIQINFRPGGFPEPHTDVCQQAVLIFSSSLWGPHSSCRAWLQLPQRPSCQKENWGWQADVSLVVWTFQKYTFLVMYRVFLLMSGNLVFETITGPGDSSRKLLSGGVSTASEKPKPMVTFPLSNAAFSGRGSCRMQGCLGQGHMGRKIQGGLASFPKSLHPQ